MRRFQIINLSFTGRKWATFDAKTAEFLVADRPLFTAIPTFNAKMKTVGFKITGYNYVSFLSGFNYNSMKMRIPARQTFYCKACTFIQHSGICIKHVMQIKKHFFTTIYFAFKATCSNFAQIKID